MHAVTLIWNASLLKFDGISIGHASKTRSKFVDRPTRDKTHFLFLAAFQYSFHVRHQSMNCSVLVFIIARKNRMKRAMV